MARKDRWKAMIPMDFDYYKPDTIDEAIHLFQFLTELGKNPVYYGGGTEIITRARAFDIEIDAVIDIKGIPLCQKFELNDNKLIIGSAITLTDIAEKNIFPLLSLTAKRIADHTIQDKITLGGNMAGTIIYNEAVLPLLAVDSDVVIASSNGQKTIPVMDLFDQGIKLNKSDLIVQVIIKEEYLSIPHIHVKRTKNDKIAYPLITMVAIKDKNHYKIAFSGLCHFPFRSLVVEDILNDERCSLETRIDESLKHLPDFVLNDIEGSDKFRMFMYKQMILEIFNKLGGE